MLIIENKQIKISMYKKKKVAQKKHRKKKGKKVSIRFK